MPLSPSAPSTTGPTAPAGSLSSAESPLWEPADATLHWIVEDYFPELAEVESVRDGGTSADVASELGGQIEVLAFPVPIDFPEGSGGSFWGRPEALLDPTVRAGISMFALLDPTVVDRGVTQLDADLESGRWDVRHGHLRSLEALDVGYRVIVSTADPDPVGQGLGEK